MASLLLFATAALSCAQNGAKDFASSLLPSDRKSTRLISSHGYISYAVFCLKKKTTPSLLVGLRFPRDLTPAPGDARRVRAPTAPGPQSFAKSIVHGPRQPYERRPPPVVALT